MEVDIPSDSPTFIAFLRGNKINEKVLLSHIQKSPQHADVATQNSLISQIQSAVAQSLVKTMSTPNSSLIHRSMNWIWSWLPGRRRELLGGLGTYAYHQQPRNDTNYVHSPHFQPTSQQAAAKIAFGPFLAYRDRPVDLESVERGIVSVGSSKELASAYTNTMLLLLRSRRLLTCSHAHDTAVIHDAVRLNSGVKLRRRFFLSLALHNSGKVLPNLIYQILQMVSQLPPGSIACVSIYDSGSSDASPLWLHLLKLLLTTLDVPFKIVADGTLTRNAGDDRIAFLSRIRNLALNAILVEGFGGKVMANDRFVFINDVFFCYSQALRLAVNEQADFSCGYDAVSNSRPFKDLHNQQPVSHTLWLYDIWVGRDKNGQFMGAGFFSSNSMDSVNIKAGLPFRVHCCWSGMAALDPTPFLNGLRFRSYVKGECQASECSLVCDDYHRLNKSRVLLDPTVFTTYDYFLARHIFQGMPLDWEGNMRLGNFNATQTSWSDAKAVQVPALHPASARNVTCCNKKDGTDGVDFNDCHPKDIFQENFTDIWLKAQTIR